MSIEEYKQSVKPGSRKDSLGHLIAARDEDSGAGLSDEELAANAAVFLLAGTYLRSFDGPDMQGVDTTGTALSYIAYALNGRPELFTLMAKELSQYNDIDSLSSIELEQLPLLNAVIKEALRLWPPAPSTTARKTPAPGTTFGGYFIPPDV